ncbi:MAG: cation diffusion facilitator family transporter [Candidatus Omnitrophica bacterium]|nr:cation diffusion facilitator family transporter [Candidatus Omnitrophota bacterium]MDD5592174.1 cation diffusion facilitator family transporter [Candidatus Omnitrophota bacterium]
MTEEARGHYQKIRRILIWILALNWLVALAKIIYGLLSRCTSMTADGLHSLSDGASNIICLIGIHFACQPKDADHPYGHKKYETFFSLGIVALLIIICVNLIREAITRLYHPLTPQVDIISFVVMVITLGINLLVMNYEYKEGKDLRSDILVSDSLHTKADIFTSLSVIITLVLIKLGYSILDPIATIVIALFIAHAAFDITRQSSRILCDTVAIMDTQRITDIVLGIRGVRTCHKIRTRGRPDDIYVDLHVQVSPDMHVDKAHKISYTIEEEIKKGIPEVTDVVVHIEPEEKV